MWGGISLWFWLAFSWCWVMQSHLFMCDVFCSIFHFTFYQSISCASYKMPDSSNRLIVKTSRPSWPCASISGRKHFSTFCLLVLTSIFLSCVLILPFLSLLDLICWFPSKEGKEVAPATFLSTLVWNTVSFPSPSECYVMIFGYVSILLLDGDLNIVHSKVLSVLWFYFLFILNPAPLHCLLSYISFINSAPDSDRRVRAFTHLVYYDSYVFSQEGPS